MCNREPFYTDYKTAVNWCGNDLILCNKIAEIDTTVYDNARFDWDENGEIFQWFLTNASTDDIEYSERTFGLLYTYSTLLDCYVLCADHFGTAWDYVPCEVFNDTWIEFAGDTFRFKH